MAHDLVRTLQLGSINFGVPGNIEQLNKPFGYYEFLDIARGATREQIQKAYREFAKKMHPDAGGKHEDFVALEKVVEVLLDDAGEHSQRAQYNRISSLDEYFDSFIEHEGQRTTKISEFMLMQMRAEKEASDLSKVSPEYANLRKKLEATKSGEEAATLVERLHEIEIEVELKDHPSEVRRSALQTRKDSKKRYKAHLEEFISSMNRNPHLYFPKALDIVYVGRGSVTFGSDMNRMRIGLLAAGQSEGKILQLILGGECYIARFPKVHFKAEEADVSVKDQNITGIFHVVKGNVSVSYESSTYGEVIRARAPSVRVVEGFQQKGDCVIPSRFAVGRWWEKKPALDIAVQTGSITLQLKSPYLAPAKDFLPYDETSKNLEKLLYDNYSYISNSKISDDKINYKDINYRSKRY